MKRLGALTLNGYDAEDIQKSVRSLLSESSEASVPELCTCVAELACSSGYGARAALQFLVHTAVENGRLSRNVWRSVSFAKRLSMLARMAGAKEAGKKPDFQRLLYALCGSILATRPKKTKRKPALTCDDIQALVFSCALDGRSGWETACGATDTTLLPELRLFGFFVTTRNLARSLQVLAYILSPGLKTKKPSACGAVDFALVSKPLDLDAAWLGQQQKKGHVVWLAWFVLLFSGHHLWTKAERRFVASTLTLHAHLFSTATPSAAYPILAHTLQTLLEKKIDEARDKDDDKESSKDAWQLPFRQVLGDGRQPETKDLHYLYTDLT
jgi:hypothetical protein